MGKRSWCSVCLFVLFLQCTFMACMKMSETYTDPEAGLNGGFEIEQNGLPVNWMLYTPNTVSDASFNIILDTENYVEGKQSLLFDVRECSSIGGRMSPGFTNEFSEIGQFAGEGTYLLSFQLKNTGAQVSVEAGAVSPEQRKNECDPC